MSADYQYERYQSINKDIKSVNSYSVRELINQHTVINENGLSYRIPKGDILDHSQNDIEAWTMKIGATLNRNFGIDKQHYVNATAGFEVRSKHSTTETYRKLGYDDQVLSWSPIDAVDLATNGTTPPWYDYPMRYYASSYDGFNDI